MPGWGPPPSCRSPQQVTNLPQGEADIRYRQRVCSRFERSPRTAALRTRRGSWHRRSPRLRTGERCRLGVAAGARAPLCRWLVVRPDSRLGGAGATGPPFGRASPRGLGGSLFSGCRRALLPVALQAGSGRPARLVRRRGSFAMADAGLQRSSSRLGHFLGRFDRLRDPKRLAPVGPPRCWHVSSLCRLRPTPLPLAARAGRVQPSVVEPGGSPRGDERSPKLSTTNRALRRLCAGGERLFGPAPEAT